MKIPTPLRRGAATLGLVALGLGVPLALALAVGWPLPTDLPSADRLREALTEGWVLDPSFVIKGLAILCWLAWAEIAVCMVVEVKAAVTGAAAPRIRFAGPLQPLVAKLVAASMVSVLVFGSRAVAVAHPPLRAAVAMYRQATPLPSVPEPARSVTESEDPAGQPPAQITVRPRDNLWDLAEAHLGDPFRWREIFELNRGRLQPDGRSLTDPSLIRPGWVLDLPDSKPHPPQTAGGATGQADAQEQPTPVGPTPNAAEDRNAASSEDEERAPEQSRPDRRPVSIHLPGGSVVSIGLALGVASALAAIRLHRRRNYRPSPPAPAELTLEADQDGTSRALLGAAQAASVSESSENAPFPFRGLSDQGSGRLVIGEREGREFDVDLSSLGGLALTGNGAYAVARSVVTTALAEGNSGVFEVVMTKTTAERLVPGVRPFEGLRFAASSGELMRIAEAELLHRTRRLADVEDLGAFGEATGEPIPTLLVVVDRLDEGERSWITTIAGLGRRLGVTPISIGSDLGFDGRIEVDDEGKADGKLANAPGILADLTLHRLMEEDGRTILKTLAAATNLAEELPLEKARAPVPSSDGPAMPVPSVEPGGLIKVQLLGAYRVEIAGQEVRKGLRSSARELLAFYLLQPHGATLERAVDTLWPDMELSKASDKFWAGVSNLRSLVRETTGEEHRVLQKNLGGYVIEPGLFEVDVWRLQTGLSALKNSEFEVERHAADVLACYGGDLLDGTITNGGNRGGRNLGERRWMRAFAWPS